MALDHQHAFAVKPIDRFADILILCRGGASSFTAWCRSSVRMGKRLRSD